MDEASKRRGRPHRKVLRFCGTEVTPSVLREIRRVASGDRHVKLMSLAARLCERFGWVRPNGELARAACLNFMRQLQRHGLLKLPEPRKKRRSEHRVSDYWRTDESCVAAFESPAGEGLKIRRVVASEREAFCALISRHHYLGYQRPVGESISYAAFLDGALVALLLWTSATMHNTSRDTFIGWDIAKKRARLRLVTNNARYLILPWIRRPHLASQILGASLRRISRDFETSYGHPVVLAETFVDGSRFKGTCYRASNWQFVGQTKGWSKQDGKYVHHGMRKDTFVYPLHRRYRDLLNGSLEMRVARPKRMASLVDVNKLPLNGKGGLFDVLATINDPRRAQGRRHSLSSILAIMVMAMLSGARSILAIAQYAAMLDHETLIKLRHSSRIPPSESTFSRVISVIDAKEVDRVISHWLRSLVETKNEAIAIDGKTARGSRIGEEPGMHLLSAVLQNSGIVIEV